MKVVLVESPSKAKTINKYLGSDYRVVASYGHVRDLPSKNGSVDPDQGFQMIWESDAKAQKHINEIIKALKGADELFLATDPDREGEAISWHVKEVLDQRQTLNAVHVRRVVFYEVTRRAVLEAMAHPRDLNQELIEAYLARRTLDYLVGFTLSPLLWRKLPGSRSAGRVQSVALRLIAERESEIEVFRSQEYWTLSAEFHGQPQKVVLGKLTHLNGKKLEKFDIATQAQAKASKEEIEKHSYAVLTVEKKQVKRHPSPPFTTSTLQQEASRKLGYGARKTMQVAQGLYEGIDVGGETVGLITYMRTDSVNISAEALTATREWIEKSFGNPYLPNAPRVYKSKAKNAQEAHEGIRPTEISRSPETVKKFLQDDQFKLYELIWKRMVASQMESALIDQVGVDIANPAQTVILRANGSTLAFDGFLKLYEEGRDDETSEEDRLLPPLEAGEALKLHNVMPDQHFTQPPPRYSEASLVKKLEELGIGRPSTYASIVSTLIERKYVVSEKKRLIPEALGRLVTTFLTSFFKKYVEYDFTAHLEEQLDDISEGKRHWIKVMEDFWQAFNHAVVQAKDLKISDVIDRLDHELERFIFPAAKEGEDVRKCTQCKDGHLGLRLGKWGAFVGCSHYPDCTYTRRVLSQSFGEEEAVETKEFFEAKTLGIDPQTRATVLLKKGPYGFYLQWDGGDISRTADSSDMNDKGKGKTKNKTGKKKAVPKPKRISLPRGISAQEITLEQALSFGALPRLVGQHPETGKPITAAIGRFGPYVKHEELFKSIGKNDNILDITLERSLELLAQTSEKRPRKVPSKKNSQKKKTNNMSSDI
ncbi:MAG: type I DNA topoisomerase [Caedimonas sp.]|nr:type I DNA topoisomerase [Caedimonas sp.]